jgi:hypothetical protein
VRTDALRLDVRLCGQRDAAAPIVLSDARELFGYTPWYFNLPDPGYEAAWKQLTDPQGFYAPCGPTTAEQRSRGFSVYYGGHECQWNGPSRPYSTAVTLTAMANLLNDYRQEFVSKKDYFDLLRIYARCHHRTREDGKTVCWIDENLDPQNGTWLARAIRHKKGDQSERGKDYNHSTFCDLVISGLVGLRPQADDTLVVNPLVPDDWDWFCLDQIRYHGHDLTIVWDRSGQHYGRGKGLQVLVDGRRVAAANGLQRIRAKLPAEPLGRNTSTKPN